LLQLVAGQLKSQQKAKRHNMGNRKPKVWLDIGGGTGKTYRPSLRSKGFLMYSSSSGWNIEAMDDYMPVSNFDAIYLIDLCEPLLEVARMRFARKGWKNVHCLHQDASKFTLPEWPNNELPYSGQISLVTMSYSLSMVGLLMLALDSVCNSHAMVAGSRFRLSKQLSIEPNMCWSRMTVSSVLWTSMPVENTSSLPKVVK
jgi:betaine lipid synthase